GPERRQRCQGQHDPPRRLCPVARHVRRWRNAIAVRRDRGRLRACGWTAARYAARRGLKVLLVDKRKEIGVPVQCGEYVAHNEEVRAIFPTVTDLDDLMGVPYRVREVDTPIIRIWSPNGRRYDIPFKGFTVQRDKMDQGIAAQAVQEGAELMTETTVVRVRGDEVKTNHGTFHGKVVVGSDGPRSTVAQSVGLEWPVSAPAMSATAVGDFGDATDMFFGNLAPGGYAGLTAADHLLDGTPLDAYESRWRSAVGGPLAEGVRIKRFADRFFGSDRVLEAAMILLGRRRMARAIRCQRLFISGRAKVL